MYVYAEGIARVLVEIVSVALEPFRTALPEMAGAITLDPDSDAWDSTDSRSRVLHLRDVRRRRRLPGSLTYLS